MTPDPSPDRTPVPRVVRLEAVLAGVERHWTPRVVARLNGQEVKVARLHGEFVWHAHEAEDELFLVLHGQLEIEFRGATLTLEPGDCVVVPRGVEHRPVAREEVHVLLFEPAGTLNTGNVRDHPLTVAHPEWSG